MPILREGSVWRKWDLHIHSPATAMNNLFVGATEQEKWEKYITALEALGEYGALGITDYLSISGYMRVREFRSQGRLGNIGEVFPNVELRILPVTAHEKAINLHVIASPTIADELSELLFANLEVIYDGNPYKCTRDGLISLGRAHSKNASLPPDGAYIVGVEQFKVDYSKVMACFRKSKKLRQSALIALSNSSNDGSSGIQHSGLEAVRTELYRESQIILSGNPKDREYFLGSGTDSPDAIRTKFGGLKPCVHGCDAHSLEKIGKPDLDRHTWIKADTTFEGLKQILFEPESRVHIGPSMPPVPIHRIRNAVLDLPINTTMRWDSSEQAFCFRGRTEAAFAPGLTCVIGGRGSGKSTLLNLLHERLAPGTNVFWQKHQLHSGEDAVLPLANTIRLDVAGDGTAIEFISQNEVEAFALDPSRLTAAIYSRFLSLDRPGSLEELAERVRQEVATAERLVQLIRRRHDLTEETADLAGRRDGCEHLLTSFADPEYVEASRRLQIASRDKSALAASRQRLLEVIAALQQTLGTSASRQNEGENPNEYDKLLSALVAGVEASVDQARNGRDLSEPGASERALDEAITHQRSLIETFLKGRGLSAENLNDIAAASQQKADFEQRLKQVNQGKAQCETEISSAVLSAGPRQNLEERFKKILEGINEQFGSGEAETRRIELRYAYDTAAAEDALIDWLLNDIEQAMPDSRPRVDHARIVLERGGPLLTTDDKDFIESIRKDETKTGQVLDVYFSRPPRLDVWNVMRRRMATDVLQFMRLEVLYDGKPLDRTSFGQRCSAVLIVLLSLGNGPIVVDEPEAHLDSALIANFMVDLVKRVKRHRQVVFATHNANFVVNGDAELVHALVADETGQTTVRSTTLEDLTTRNLILALEGGELAFRLREGRYGLEP